MGDSFWYDMILSLEGDARVALEEFMQSRFFLAKFSFPLVHFYA